MKKTVAFKKTIEADVVGEFDFPIFTKCGGKGGFADCFSATLPDGTVAIIEVWEESRINICLYHGQLADCDDYEYHSNRDVFLGAISDARRLLDRIEEILEDPGDA